MTSLAANGAGPRREILLDAALALPVAALAIGGTAGELASATAPTPPAVGGYLIALAAAATLVWRRQRPAVVAVAALAIAASYPLIGYPGWAPMLAMFVALFSLSAYGATQRALYGALALCVITYLLPVVSTQRWSPWSPAVWAPAVSLVWVSLLGAATRRRRLAGEEHVRQVATVAAAQARERMADERLQVARELHDVLAHTISVIAVQSGLAIDALDDDIDMARRALGTIRASTKEALAELRATLTLLRADAAGAASARPTRPQPRLADLPDLVAQTCAAGLAVTLSCDLADTAVDGRGGVDGAVTSPAVELTAFRVVQESLTNVVRHANATSVAVEVRRHADQLRVTVADDGYGPQGDRSGFGVRGMRERVAALGGTFVAGPGPERGYEVRAVLPL
jgi:signal transduction histidine kinase